MLDLDKGYTIQTKGFKKVVVDKKLGEGGQGAVYRVVITDSRKPYKKVRRFALYDRNSICQRQAN